MDESELRMRQGEVRRACYEFAPRHKATVGGEGDSWHVELQGLGHLWVEEHGDGPRIVADSSNIGTRARPGEADVRWRFAYGDYESLRDAVAHGVEHLLRAAPSDVRNQ